MKLIVEAVDNIETIIEESVTGEKKYYIKGPYLQADIRNQNGNLYPLKVVNSALAKYQRDIDRKAAVGELDHPGVPKVSLDKICHKIIEMKLDPKDKIVYGKSLVVEEGVGKVVIGLIKADIAFGVSLRALGTLNRDKVMQDDFHLLAVDVVKDPSFANAMMGVVMESKDYFIKDGEVYEMAHNNLVTNYRTNDPEKNFRLLNDFINTLKTGK